MNRIKKFLRNQTNAIRKGCAPVLSQKICLFFGMVMVIPVVLLVRVLRPIVTIRFGGLGSSRIGDFAASTEIYLCERDRGYHGRRVLDIFYCKSSVCNRQLKKMWSRILPISCFAKPLDKVNRLLFWGKKHVVPWRRDNQSRDIYDLVRRVPGHLSFTHREQYHGREECRKLGIPEGSSFVCFHARDNTYLDHCGVDRPCQGWGYHDFRDSSIHHYISAAREMVRRGHYAVRVGAIVKEALNISDSQIIDYAVNGRTDFLDIFLIAKCQFLICSATGLEGVAVLFRKPIVYVNYVPLPDIRTVAPNYLFIFKKLWLCKEHRFLTFKEILNSETGNFYRSEQYEEAGIKLIENTPEEIRDVAVEMDERLKGMWQTTEEDEQLQRRFRTLFKPSEINPVFASRIGTEFLRQNRDLLK